MNGRPPGVVVGGGGSGGSSGSGRHHRAHHRVMVVMIAGGGRQERRRRARRHEIGRQTGGRMVMMLRIEDRVMVLIEIQRRFTALMDVGTCRRRRRRRQMVVMMQLMVMVLDTLQMVMMAQLVMVVEVSRSVLGVRHRNGRSVMIDRSADAGHQILETDGRIGGRQIATAVGRIVVVG